MLGCSPNLGQPEHLPRPSESNTHPIKPIQAKRWGSMKEKVERERDERGTGDPQKKKTRKKDKRHTEETKNEGCTLQVIGLFKRRTDAMIFGLLVCTSTMVN